MSGSTAGAVGGALDRGLALFERANAASEQQRKDEAQQLYGRAAVAAEEV